MKFEVKIPQQGFTTEYVTLTKIYVAEGDSVKEGMPLCEMESDKATMDIESSFSGKVASILKSEGAEANIGEVIMTIEG
jgi:pyruvate/2-oxoglutarate dehydrogenase complex dihydrolipoamide acyltransferase (E2) component